MLGSYHHKLSLVACFFLGLTAIFQSACDSKIEDIDLDSNCLSETKGSCSVESEGGRTNWMLSNVPSNHEYVIAFVSRATPNFRDPQHILNLSSTTLSDPVPEAEVRLSNQIAAREQITLNEMTRYYDNHISAPPPNFNPPLQNLTDLEFYIPDPSNYMTHTATNTIPFSIALPGNNQLTGQRAPADIFSEIENSFRLLINRHSYNASVQSLSLEQRNYLQSLHDCLTRVVPNTMSLIGSPMFRLQNETKLNILSGDIPQNQDRTSLGMISEVDRFKTENGREIVDSNKTEVIYLARGTLNSTSYQCSTAAHEYQHLLSFDAKVLSRMPGDNRYEMSLQKSLNLNPEFLGLNEGYSHIVEEISEEQQGVSKNIFSFLSSPNFSTFALETVWRDAAQNFRSRGLNTLFLYSMLRRAGGTLNSSDYRTRNFLQTLIRSQFTGFENIARYFGTTENELLQYFFTHLAQALFDSNKVGSLLPPFEENLRAQRGVRLLDRSTPSTVSLTPNLIHPLQFDLLPITRNSSYAFPAQSVLFFRFIVPQNYSTRSPKITFSGDGSPYSLFVIPVR